MGRGGTAQILRVHRMAHAEDFMARIKGARCAGCDFGAPCRDKIRVPWPAGAAGGNHASSVELILRCSAPLGLRSDGREWAGESTPTNRVTTRVRRGTGLVPSSGRRVIAGGSARTGDVLASAKGPTPSAAALYTLFLLGSGRWVARPARVFH